MQLFFQVTCLCCIFESTSAIFDETAATGGVMYTDEGKLEFDEDKMAALEGQRLVAEFTCGI